MYTAHFYVAVTMSVKISQMKLKAPCVMGRCMKMYNLLCYKNVHEVGGVRERCGWQSENSFCLVFGFVL